MPEKFNILKLHIQANRKKIAGLAVFALVISIISQSMFPILTNAGNIPAFNIFTPYSHTQAYNRDYYFLDAKNDSDGGTWNNTVSADAGDILTFYIYYHNGENDTVAHNTTVRVNLPSGSAFQQTVSAYLWADNASNASASNPFQGSVRANLSTNQRLEFISGSVQWFPNQGNWNTDSATQFPGNQSENLLFSSGINLGDIEGCWEFSGAIVFKARVSQTQYNASLSIDKKLKNVSRNDSYWTDGPLTGAGPQQTIGVQITITNNGNADANNVIVQDILPGRLYYRSGSTRIDNSWANDGIINGYNIGAISAGQTKTIYFEAQTGIEREFLPRGDHYLTNMATARADGIGQLQDSATIVVSYNGCNNQDYGSPAGR